MTLVGYQQALCDLVASPGLCLRVRADSAVLDRYVLTQKEHSRLAAIVKQRGMSTSCTLYRVNRITPLFSYLPLTCTLLGDDLLPEAERYWAEARPEDLQFGPETLRFGRFLRRRLEEGGVPSPYLSEVLELELAAHALRWGANPPTRIVQFSHDPAPLLQALADGRRPAADEVSQGRFIVELDASNGTVRMNVRTRMCPRKNSLA